jgi:hypothetical protein
VISPLCNIEHRRCSRPTYASRQRMALFQTTCL